MHLLVVALATLLSSASLAQGFVIPEGTKDGVYILEMADDQKGQVILKYSPDLLLTASNTTDPSPPPDEIGTSVDEIPQNPPHHTQWPKETFHACIHTYVDLGNVESSISDFNAACSATNGRLLTNKRALVVVRNSVVSYECSYKKSGVPCVSEEWLDANDWVIRKCDTSIQQYTEPGYVFIKKWEKSYGYGITGVSFC